MNSKMTINSQLSTAEPKNKNKRKLSKQLEEEQINRNRGHMEDYQHGGGRVRNGGKDTRNKKHKWQVQNRQGQAKNNIRNVEAKELICTMHGHELRGGW